MVNNELTIHKDNLVSVIENKGLDSVIKPLSQEIYLFDSYIARDNPLERYVCA